MTKLSKCKACDGNGAHEVYQGPDDAPALEQCPHCNGTGNETSPVPTAEEINSEKAKLFLKNTFKLVDLHGLTLNGVEWAYIMEEYATTKTQEIRKELKELQERFDLKNKEYISKLEISINRRDKVSDLTTQNQRLQERVNAAINQLKEALFNVKVSKDKNLFEIRMELLLKELTS